MIRSIHKEVIAPVPTPLDYVEKLEARYRQELAGSRETGLCRQLCEVAFTVLEDERNPDNWQELAKLRERVNVVAEWLIDHDRW